MDKKGEKVISVYWFAILFIVAGAIVYMTSVFYGQPYDIREIEADLLTDKIAECFSQEGYLREDFESINDENFLSECGLTFDVEEAYNWRDQSEYYVEVHILDFNAGNELKNITVGNSGLKTNCDFEGKYLPYCLERSFYTVSQSGEGEGQLQYRFNTLVIIRKTEKNTQ